MHFGLQKRSCSCRCYTRNDRRCASCQTADAFYRFKMVINFIHIYEYKYAYRHVHMTNASKGKSVLFTALLRSLGHPNIFPLLLLAFHSPLLSRSTFSRSSSLRVLRPYETLHINCFISGFMNCKGPSQSNSCGSWRPISETQS